MAIMIIIILVMEPDITYIISHIFDDKNITL